MKLGGCNALITGASAGIGREFARQLAGRAQSLILIARRDERLNELRDELNQQYPNLAVSVRKTDLADLAHLNELLAWLDHERIDVDLLINDAGLGDSGAFARSHPVRNEQMILVNIVALTTLTRHLLPQMIAKRHGGILNVSSSAGFLPIPDFAVYAATKAYVTSFSEALRAELRGTGVSVCALCPGPVHTEFQEVAKRPGCSAGYRPGVRLRSGRTCRARCACSTGGGPTACYSRLPDETRNVSRPNNADADACACCRGFRHDGAKLSNHVRTLSSSASCTNILKMKQVVLACEHNAVDHDLRRYRKR